MVLFPMTLSDPNLDYKVRHYSVPNNWKMVQDGAILTMADQ